MATLYRIECTVTGKSYIGICLCSVKQRWLSHCASARKGSRQPLHADIRKYGASAFKRYVIQRDISEDHATLVQIEAEAIKKRNTLFPNGYNRRLGGGTFRHSEETKRKISKSRKQWLSNKSNLKRLSKSLRKYKNSPEGKTTMKAAGKKSWETRRARYTPEQLAEIARRAAMKRDNSNNARKGWATRRANYTKEEISKQSSEGLKKWHAKVRQLLETKQLNNERK